MNNSLYEEYMRSVLGYDPMDYRNTYDMNFDNMSNNNMMNYNEMKNEEIEDCYPDIYRLVYPMVQKACMQNTRPMTRELIDNMTNEIYFAIEDNDITATRSKEDKNEKGQENRGEDRQRIRNNTLNDLIRILLLRELIGRPGFPIRPRPPVRPPRPPMRPPMGPGPRPPRPGMRTYNNQGYNMFDDGYDIFEY